MMIDESQLSRNRSFFLLWSGNAMSLVGFHGARIAYPLLVLATTDSPAAAGWVRFALGAPILIFQIPSGIAADRFDRLRILMICQVVGLLAVCLVATSVLVEARHLGTLVAVAAFVEGTVYVFVEVCELGAIQDVLSAEQRPAAFAFLEAEQPIALLLGRAAGGTIYGLARWLPFIVDAATYLYCLVALALIRPNRTRSAPADLASRSELRDIGAGMRVVWHEPLLRASTATIGMSNLIIQIVLLLLLFELQTTGYPAWTIGVVLSAWASEESWVRSAPLVYRPIVGTAGLSRQPVGVDGAARADSGERQPDCACGVLGRSRRSRRRIECRVDPVPGRHHSETYTRPRTCRHASGQQQCGCVGCARRRLSARHVRVRSGAVGDPGSNVHPRGRRQPCIPASENLLGGGIGAVAVNPDGFRFEFPQREQEAMKISKSQGGSE